MAELFKLTRPGDIDLEIRAWAQQNAHAVAFYIHGAQSHSGWLYETGPEVAGHGVAVYAADRRGSGNSKGVRGDIESFRIWIDDYIAVIDWVRARHPDLPLTIVGQSRGGSISAALAADPRARWEAIVFVAPALDQHLRYTEEQRRARTVDRRTELTIDVAIPDEHYSQDPTYLRFMAEDSAMLRRVSPRLIAELLALDLHVAGLGAPFAGRPALFLAPTRDLIVDLTLARTAFMRLTDGTGLTMTCPAEDHYIEFSAWRQHYWRLLAIYATTLGFERTTTTRT